MSTESDAAVGRLAVMDAALNDLLRDLAGEIILDTPAVRHRGRDA
jgi:hypothetical protein